MTGRVLEVHEMEPQRDPYRAGRFGLWLRFACPAGSIDTPVATALRRLPHHDWMYDSTQGSWWVAEEHLPVLRRLLANFDECFRATSVRASA